MRTIKLVIIGDSGVGKTSLRSSYVSGRFSTGYRATIGTDFITKVLSHHSNPDEVVTLQIWDTAGQERFSSLSTAFFRGADAVLMMYDVNKPQTLHGLKKWWKEFQERAPVPDEDASDYCCVVVGNKLDLAEELERGRKMLVSEEDAQLFLEQLIPFSPVSPVSTPVLQPSASLPQMEDLPVTIIPGESSHPRPNGNSGSHAEDNHEGDHDFQPRPIDIRHSGHGPSVSRATSRSRLGGTMTTTHTGLSTYHTPSSSFHDEFVSAPSSPIHSNTSSHAISRGTIPRSASSRRTTTSTTSSSDTITPSLFARPPSISTTPTPLPLDRGPRLFLTSAKTGQSVPLVFEYIAKRVVLRWEWEETVQERTFDYTDPAETGTVRLAQSLKKDSGWTSTCCS
ncbi:P-loop containing nucleoside triphosphate hydrolase protein [Gautieria morchelliformis]|nr:P-loop containing nucleoside triphosphate hydrolase protein [Gautieria morchelliformis]